MLDCTLQAKEMRFLHLVLDMYGRKYEHLLEILRPLNTYHRMIEDPTSEVTMSLKNADLDLIVDLLSEYDRIEKDIPRSERKYENLKHSILESARVKEIT